MKPNVKYGAFLASLLLVMPLAAYADQGKGQYASEVLQLQMSAMTCRNTYVTSYLGDVVTVINNDTVTSTLANTDIPKLGTDYTALQADASANNTSQFKADVKTYNTDTKTANLDARSDIKTVHSKAVNTTLRSDIKPLLATYQGCTFGIKQQYAELKGQMFNNALSHMQNMTQRWSSHGMNTTSLENTISGANAGVQGYENAVNNAQNMTQLRQALNSFCLYDGCKNPTDFHLAAKAELDREQARLNLLASENSTSTYQGLVAQAQTDINNAQSALGQVGTGQYQGNQSGTIFGDLKAAQEIIHQLQIANHKH